jgi:hypothetical protein
MKMKTRSWEMGKTLIRHIEAMEEWRSTDLVGRNLELRTTIEPRTA